MDLNAEYWNHQGRPYTSLQTIYKSFHLREWDGEDNTPSNCWSPYWNVVCNFCDKRKMAKNTTCVFLQLHYNLLDFAFYWPTFVPVSSTCSAFESNQPDMDAWRLLNICTSRRAKRAGFLVRFHAISLPRACVHGNVHRSCVRNFSPEHAFFDWSWPFFPTLVADILLWEIFEQKNSGRSWPSKNIAISTSVERIRSSFSSLKYAVRRWDREIASHWCHLKKDCN